MSTKMPEIKELFKAGAHFGHQKSRSDARSKKFVYGYKNKISIIDLEKTIKSLDEALKFIEAQANRGSLFLFVGTKMQSKTKIKTLAESLDFPYIVERWPGGLLTNFDMVSKTIKRMTKTEKEIEEHKYDELTKKERLQIEKGLAKTKIAFGGLSKLERIPEVLIIVDAKQEDIAIKEARIKGIATVAICDTNANPKMVDFPIMANDDSKKTVELILDLVGQAIKTNFKPKVVAEEVAERVDGSTSSPQGSKAAASKDVKLKKEVKSEESKAEKK